MRAPGPIDTRTATFRPLASIVKQICNLLHIDFQKRQSNSKLSLIWIELYVVEYVTHGSRYQPILKLLHLHKHLLLIAIGGFVLLLFAN